MKPIYLTTASSVFLLLSLSFLGGCASKQTSGLDQVTASKTNIKETSDKLSDAEEKLKDFQNDLRDMKAEFKSSGTVATQAKATEALDRLALKVEQTQLDLKEITIQNRAVGKDLDTRLIEAAKQNEEVSNQ